MIERYGDIIPIAESLVTDATRIEVAENPAPIDEGFAFVFVPRELPDGFTRTTAIVDPHTGASTYDFMAVVPNEDGSASDVPTVVNFDDWLSLQPFGENLDVSDVYRLRHATVVLASNALEGAMNG